MEDLLNTLVSDKKRLNTLTSRRFGGAACSTVMSDGSNTFNIYMYEWVERNLQPYVYCRVTIGSLRRKTYELDAWYGSKRDECLSIIKEWIETSSVYRQMDRTKEFKEELMMNRWHPNRVFKLLEMGYDEEDM